MGGEGCAGLSVVQGLPRLASGDQVSRAAGWHARKGHPGPVEGCGACAHERLTCESKRVWWARERAEAAAQAINELGPSRWELTARVEAYECWFCEGWHHTSVSVSA